MNNLLLLLFLVPNLVMAEKAPLNNKGLLCSQAWKCENDFPESEIHISAYEVLLESGVCKNGYAAVKDLQNSIFNPLYMPPIRLWCKSHFCSQPFIDGEYIKDNKLPYEANTSTISVHRYNLNRNNSMMTQYFMGKPFYYRCEITTNKKNVYKPLKDELKKIKEEKNYTFVR